MANRCLRYVYRLDPASGKLTVVSDDFDKPNGIAFSPDEKMLYVADTGGSHDPDGAHHIRAFDVVGGKKLAKEYLAAGPGQHPGEQHLHFCGGGRISWISLAACYRRSRGNYGLCSCGNLNPVHPAWRQLAFSNDVL